MAVCKLTHKQVITDKGTFFTGQCDIIENRKTLFQHKSKHVRSCYVEALVDAKRIALINNYLILQPITS